MSTILKILSFSSLTPIGEYWVQSWKRKTFFFSLSGEHKDENKERICHLVTLIRQKAFQFLASLLLPRVLDPDLKLLVMDPKHLILNVKNRNINQCPRSRSGFNILDFGFKDPNKKFLIFHSRIRIQIRNLNIILVPEHCYFLWKTVNVSQKGPITVNSLIPYVTRHVFK